MLGETNQIQKQKCIFRKMYEIREKFQHHRNNKKLWLPKKEEGSLKVKVKGHKVIAMQDE